MLALIWTLSLILAGLSLLVMSYLVVRRVIQDRRSVHHAAARDRLFAALIRFGGDRDAEALRRVVCETPPQVVATRGFEIIDLLRGDEHAATVAVFVETGLPAHVRRRLRRGDDAERLHAAELLATFAGEDDVGALLDTLCHDRSREVRLASAISLAGLDRLPPLAEVLDRLGPRGLRSRRLVDLFGSLPSDRLAELRAYAGDQAAPGPARAAAVDA